MKLGKVFVLLLSACACALSDDSDVVLKPKDLSGTPAVLFFFQAKQFSVETYTDLTQQLQTEFFRQKISLWVGIPACSVDLVSQTCIETGIARLRAALGQLGLPASAPVILGAHGDGGEQIQLFVAQNPFAANCTILLSSTLLPQYANSTFPVPVLSVGGTLDGLSSIMKRAASFHTLIDLQPPGQRNATRNTPVVAVDGMSFAQASTAQPPPGYAWAMDLRPAITGADARLLVAQAAASFVGTVLLAIRPAWAQLQALVDDTRKTVAPLVAALELEGYYGFAPPCYEARAPCQKGSDWMSQFAQASMGGLGTSDAAVVNTDLFWPVSEVIPHDYLPIINTTCTTPGPECKLFTRTVTQPAYNDSFVAAQEMMAKLNSRQRVRSHAGLNASDFNVTDCGPRCGDINAAAFAWALRSSAIEAQTRFAAIGQALVMRDDINIIVYPLWSSRRLTFTAGALPDGTPVMEVAAPTMRFEIGLPAVGGLHFCKLLSPARAMEWVYVDGLRLRGGLNVTVV